MAKPIRKTNDFKAEMILNQVSAIAHKILKLECHNDILDTKFYKKLNTKLYKNKEIEEIKKWLINSWNTETILNISLELLKNNGHYNFIIQWAFPQAYYSIFCSILANFKAKKFTEKSHNAVIKKFNKLIKESYFPKCITYYANGTINNINYTNLTKTSSFSSIKYDKTNNLTIDNQICQLLKSTRESKFKNEKNKWLKNLNIKTQNGKLKKKLNENDKSQIFENIGITSLLDYLYKLRIKANYKDIDIFTYENINSIEIINNLLIIVENFNFINEIYIAKMIGKDKFIELNNNARINNPKIKNRVEEIINLINNS